jgi:hypothetical protein
LHGCNRSYLRGCASHRGRLPSWHLATVEGCSVIGGDMTSLEGRDQHVSVGARRTQRGVPGRCRELPGFAVVNGLLMALTGKGLANRGATTAARRTAPPGPPRREARAETHLPTPTISAVWRCPVCEAVNQGGRTCTACGAAMPYGQPLRAAVRSRLPIAAESAPPPVPPTPLQRELRELPAPQELRSVDPDELLSSDSDFRIGSRARRLSRLHRPS